MENVNQWYFTKDQLANTPSRKHDIDAAKELSYRQQAANFIQDMGQRLQVTQLCINTAIVYMHRFYIFHSFKEVHRNNISISSLFLAAKVEEQPRKLEHVIKVAHMCLHKDASPLDVKCEPYQDKVNETVAHENVLLQTLGFVLAIEHPHTYVVKVCQLVKASKELAQSSYIMATTSLHMTTMCLQYKPTVVACVCIHLACKWSSYMIEPCSEGRDWFYYVDRSVTWELLERLTQEYISILERSPHRFKNKFGKQDASGYHGPNSDCVLPSNRASTSSGSIEYTTLPAILDSMPSSIQEQPTSSDKEAKPSTNSDRSDKNKGKLLFTNPKEKSNSNHSETTNAIKPKEESTHSRQLPPSTSVANVLNTVQSTFFQSATKPLSPLEKIEFNLDNRVGSKSDGVDGKHEEQPFVKLEKIEIKPDKINLGLMGVDVKREKAAVKADKPPSYERKHKSKHSSKDKSSSNADKSSSNHHKPGIKIKIPKDIISRVPESNQKYSVPSRPENPKEPLKIKLPIPPTQREPPKEASTSLKLVITKDKFGSGSYSTSQKHHDRENRKRVHSSSNLVLDGAAHHRNSEMPSKHPKVDHNPKSRHDDSSRSGKVSRRDHSAKAAASKHNDGTTFHNYNVSAGHQNYYPMVHPHMQRVHGLPVDRTNSNPPLPPPIPPPPPPPEEHGYRNGL